MSSRAKYSVLFLRGFTKRDVRAATERFRGCAGALLQISKEFFVIAFSMFGMNRVWLPFL